MGITRSLSRMTGATERIAEGRFDVSNGPTRGDELGRLEEAIRRMAARLEGFVNGQKRFLGDVAHELCSPLARMEMALGILEQRADERQREYVDDVSDEVRQMSALVNELLSFSKAGLKGREVPLVAVPLAPLAAQVAAREGGSSDAVKLDVPAELSAMADADLLARAVGNLVRNALRHGGSPPSVALTALVSGDQVLFRVSDEGPGVPPEALARLGEPFFRPDLARTREAGGVGLGLAIVRACAAACGGTVEFRNREPRGFEAELRLRRL
jgi:two-component system sensor histidine kinase CpxA